MGIGTRSPSQLRSIFGTNLERLARAYPSISDLARRLDINRTQLNRYLSGESFPRPDVLARICAFFDVDARILLEPVEEIGRNDDPLTGPVLGPYLGVGAANLPDHVFPAGFYRFSRRSFVDPSRFVVGIVRVFREGRNTYMKGYESKEATYQQGLPTDGPSRAFVGLVMHQEEGISMIMSRTGAVTFGFTFLHRASSFENNFWIGYACRTTGEVPETERVVRLVYEYLGHELPRVITAARIRGLQNEEVLPPLHRRYLQPDRPFR